jgi:hypothetical protein
VSYPFTTCHDESQCAARIWLRRDRRDDQ